MAEKYFIAIKTAAWMRMAQNLHSGLNEKGWEIERERERERERKEEQENLGIDSRDKWIKSLRKGNN